MLDLCVFDLHFRSNCIRSGSLKVYHRRASSDCWSRMLEVMPLLAVQQHESTEGITDHNGGVRQGWVETGMDPGSTGADAHGLKLLTCSHQRTCCPSITLKNLFQNKQEQNTTIFITIIQVSLC